MTADLELPTAPRVGSGPAPVIVQGLYSFQIGGSEKLGALLARQLRGRGYTVHALSFFDYDGPIRAELEAADVACAGLGLLERGFFGKRLLRDDARAFYRRVGASVVHLHHANVAMKGARAAKRAGASRVVMTEHSDQQLRGGARYRRMTLDALPHVDTITVINAELFEYFRDDLGVDPGRMRVIPNAVDPCYAELLRDPAARARLGLDDAFVFSFVGRLVPEKDVGVLLEALSIVRREVASDVRVVIAGDGEQRAFLQSRAQELGVAAQVAWLGAQPDARTCLALADAFAMSSESEGVPMALLEAMSAGLPCIATDVGGIGQVLAGGNGLLCPRKDPPALAAAMRRVVEDPAFAQRLGRTGAASIAARYSVDSVVDRYLDAFGLPARWAGAST
jgi:glycosyltransferase involved in cell wall biosynthesis